MKYLISPVRPSSLNDDFLGEDHYVEYIAPLDGCNESTITFYKGEDINRIESINSGILIIDKKLKNQLKQFSSKAIVFSENPMLLFAKVINSNYENSFTESQLSKEARNNSMVSSNAVIEENVILGEKTKIFPNVTIFNKTTIGTNCVIQSGSVLGAIGMSYIKDKDDTYYRMSQLGDLHIADNVDIGTNVSILRGIMESTIIGNGTKIGNNVNIGHNVIIGENCYISSGVTIGGACKIGNNCWISPGVTISDHILIAENSHLGVGSVVIKDTIEGGFYLGNPARKVK
ncbi:MAG: UDP-3-O-(3-hydroxymyristoyl)glucosamine N-acyltransferase [Ignavibacteriae bacterium]|nr:UDP-3-O-(3-hydroxymyristoyl)glucosamine N-acyltransferase [Ignavibacteriota bacterium]